MKADDPNILKFAVDPRRLAYDDAKHADISNAYSADVIAMQGTVRRPFVWQGFSWVTVGTQGSGLAGGQHAEAYKLIPVKAYSGTPTTYAEKVRGDGEDARNDPNGFYHGMTVKHGGESYIMHGPPALFVPETKAETAQEPQQLDMFSMQPERPTSAPQREKVAGPCER